MITARDLVLHTRRKAKDMQGVRYSDYEVVSAINEAVLYLASAMCRVWSPELVRTAELPGGNAPLPEGFLGVESASGAFRIEGDTIITDIPVSLAYRKSPGEIQAVEMDSVDLRAAYLGPIAESAAHVLMGEMESVLAISERQALLSKRALNGPLPEPGMWQ